MVSRPACRALPIATMIGRPIGVLAGGELAILAGLHRTPPIGWKELLVIGCTTSIGLTSAFFMACTIFAIGPLCLQTKTGALLTSGGAILALVVAWSLGVGRFHAAVARKATL